MDSCVRRWQKHRAHKKLIGDDTDLKKKIRKIDNLRVLKEDLEVEKIHRAGSPEQKSQLKLDKTTEIF